MTNRTGRTRRRLAAALASGALVILGVGYAFAARTHPAAEEPRVTTLTSEATGADADETEVEESVLNGDPEEADDVEDAETPEPEADA